MERPPAAASIVAETTSSRAGIAPGEWAAPPRPVRAGGRAGEAAPSSGTRDRVTPRGSTGPRGRAGQERPRRRRGLGPPLSGGDGNGRRPPREQEGARVDLQRGSNGTASRTEARPRGFARLSGVLALLLALSGSIAVADPPSGSDRPIIGDDWVLSIGAFIAEFKIDAAVGVGSVVSTTVRFEDQLGIDRERSIFRLEGFHRFSERHALEFGFWTAERQGDAVLDSQIEFEGNLFDVDATVNSWVDTSWFRLGWRYSMVSSDRGEAGIEFGLSIYDTALGIDGEATVVDPDGTTRLEAVRTEESVLAPVPTFGIFLNQSLRPNLTLLVSADFMDVTLGELELDLTDVTAMLVWNFSRHVGAGLGLNKSNGEFRDSGSSPYSIGFSRTGLLGYMALRF